MRDHDFGKDVKNEQHSDFPYMFPDQLVESGYSGIEVCSVGGP